jgi:hypothetical protein
MTRAYLNLADGPGSCANAASQHRATHEPSPVSRSRPFRWVSTFAVALSLFCILYFGLQLVRGAL